MIFGLTGRSGRLSRLAALLGAALVVGTFVALAIAGRDVGPDTGAILGSRRLHRRLCRRAARATVIMVADVVEQWCVPIASGAIKGGPNRWELRFRLSHQSRTACF